MANLKKNFAYNSFLTVSTYLINLIIFPYCARVLGVERFGTINFAQNIVQYFLFIGAMGITHIGVREIAKQKDKEDLNECFSSILSLNILFTFFSLLIYIPIILFVNKLSVQKELFFLGGIQLLFSSFSIEWFYRGIEDYKFITIRSIIIKIIYIASVFIFINDSDDYVLFYALTVFSIVINIAVNFLYSIKFVTFSFKNLNIKKYFKSSLLLGFYSILTSMYTTFNVTYLGFVWNDTEVGYYTTSLKIYSVVLGFYTAFTSVMLPRMSAVAKDHDEISFKKLINSSFELLLTFSLPLLVCLMIMAPEIVWVLAGEEYMPSVLLSRIIMPMLLVVGIAQILVFQIIIPKGLDGVTFKGSIIGAFVGVLLNIILTTKYSSVGTCITVVITELCVTGYYIYIVNKHKMLYFNFKIIYNHILWTLPYLIFCVCSKVLVKDNEFITLFISVLSSLLYFVISQKYLIKNPLFQRRGTAS